MPCQHAEDVCQDCLKKVKTKTEDSTPSHQEKKALQKKSQLDKTSRILIDSAVLGVVGYVAFYNAKFLLKTFDYGVSVVKDILENILH